MNFENHPVERPAPWVTWTSTTLLRSLAAAAVGVLHLERMVRGTDPRRPPGEPGRR